MDHQTVAITAAVRQRWIAELQRAGCAHLVPLVEMLGRGAVFAEVWPGMPCPREIKRCGAVLILQDDSNSLGDGPEAFNLPSLRRLARRCWAWAVLAGHAPVDVYEDAARKATAGKTVIIVSTQPNAEHTWLKWLEAHAPKRAGKLLI